MERGQGAERPGREEGDGVHGNRAAKEGLPGNARLGVEGLELELSVVATGSRGEEGGAETEPGGAGGVPAGGSTSDGDGEAEAATGGEHAGARRAVEEGVGGNAGVVGLGPIGHRLEVVSLEVDGPQSIGEAAGDIEEEGAARE